MNLKSIIPWKDKEQPTARRGGGGDPFALLQRPANGLLDDFWGGSLSRWGGGEGAFLPTIDVSESDKDIRVTAELPGLEEKDVEVTLSDDLLTIKGEKKSEIEEDGGDHYHSERRYGFFSRSVALPQGIDPDHATAKFRRGVLKVTVPKKPDAQRTRRKIQLMGS